MKTVTDILDRALLCLILADRGWDEVGLVEGKYCSDAEKQQGQELLRDIFYEREL